MKIGLFTDTYYPQINGVATSVLMLKENLEKLGHKVYVFTTTDPKAERREKNVYRVASVPFKSSRRVGLFYNPRLAKHIRKLNLDIIHTHTEFTLGIFGRVMARELDIPLLHTYHTIYENYTHYIVKLGALNTIAKSAARKFSARFCNSADKVIVPTEKIKDLLISYNVKKEISIIPTGIELDKFSRFYNDSDMINKLKADLNINPNDKVILYIGRISEEKSIDQILIAMQLYFKDKDDVKLVLIGDGPDKISLEEKAKELGIYNQTIFAGERPWDEIGMYYQLGDVFVSASQSETQGLTYIEALASGVPVVAKADRCLEGVIKEGVNGYTYHIMEELYHYLDSILFDDLEKNRLSVGAIKSIDKFSGANFALAIEEEYIDIIKTKKRYRRAS